jgi:hypothetical protein
LKKNTPAPIVPKNPAIIAIVFDPVLGKLGGVEAPRT